MGIKCCVAEPASLLTFYLALFYVLIWVWWCISVVLNDEMLVHVSKHKTLDTNMDQTYGWNGFWRLKPLATGLLCLASKWQICIWKRASAWAMQSMLNLGLISEDQVQSTDVQLWVSMQSWCSHRMKGILSMTSNTSGFVYKVKPEFIYWSFFLIVGVLMNSENEAVQP